MKLKWVTCVLLLLVAVNIRLHAQQSDADRKIFEEAKAKAEKGDASAQCALGVFYVNGKGVAKDPAEAVKWFRKADEQENADAQLCLGMQYAVGNGVSKNVAEAAKWYRKAAEHGLAHAQMGLGLCYRDGGDGVPQDLIEAAKWFRRAAEQGEATAQFELGRCYILGNGVITDNVQAYKWLNLASVQGPENAKTLLHTIEKQMTLEQIAEAQKLSREFVHKGESPSSQTLLAPKPSNKLPEASEPVTLPKNTKNWLSGQITSSADGTIMPFRIEKKFAWGGSATGGVAAANPNTGERFTGSYSAVLPKSRGTASAYSLSTGWVNVQTTQTSQTANAIATLTGDKGTVIQLEIQIQSGLRPHGIGSGSDNQNRHYQVQF